jgi:hypothetical protein
MDAMALLVDFNALELLLILANLARFDYFFLDDE